MTVQELIDELKNFAPTDQVAVWDYDFLYQVEKITQDEDPGGKQPSITIYVK